MSTTYNHIRMSTVDASNNVAVLYPETTASDVSVSRTNNANIPQSVTNIQLLANALATSAFTNPISDSTTSSTSTWSSNKINTALTNVSVYVDSTDGKLHFVNSAGTDSALNFNKASGTATADKVLTGFTFSNSSGIDIPGEMVNNGAISQTVNPGSSYTIPAGYHNGNGVVTANTVENTLTYTFASGSTGATVDLGANNTYRYVNAANVYAKGQADGATTHTGTFTLTTTGSAIDMGINHTYRYINTGTLIDPSSYPLFTSNVSPGYMALADVSGPGYYYNPTYESITSSKTSMYFSVSQISDNYVIMLGYMVYSKGYDLNTGYTWSEACNLSWDITFPANTIFTDAVTINNCKIPSYFDFWSNPKSIKIIYMASNGARYDGSCWTSKISGSNYAYYLSGDYSGSNGSIYQSQVTNKFHVVPAAKIYGRFNH